ncbi:MAG: hypothetical protein HC782_01480 [Gammaproteobacteria bacterium]|nr:hypothetical protein [Gammaproteobacteria bacterium]
MRNTARINSAIWSRPDDERYDWEIFAGIASKLAVLLNRSYKTPPSVREVVRKATVNSVFHETSMAALQAAPHGLDLGALTPSLYSRLETPNNKIVKHS